MSCLLLGLGGSGCTNSAAIAQLTDIKVTEHGADPGGEFCQDFRFNDAQASDFFARAIEIDADKLHELDTLPCYVHGTAQLAGKPATWMVRAGGTAEVDTESSNVLMACASCGDLLSGKAN